MIFVDTNVFMYAVGKDHPLRDEARALFKNPGSRSNTLVTSAEVLQELMHAYVRVGRTQTLRNALTLVRRTTEKILPLEPEDVFMAARTVAKHPHLSSRDLTHLAFCKRRDIKTVASFDRALIAAFNPPR